MEATRAAHAADVARIVELARAMRQELAALKGGELWLRREARPEPLADGYEMLLARDDARVVVGTVHGVVVGFGVVEIEPLRDGAALGRITDLFVESGARSVGVGEAMIGALLEFSGARMCVGVDALALPGHRATKNFFEESGFTARAIMMHRSAPPEEPPPR